MPCLGIGVHPALIERQTMKPPKHHTHWTVLYASGYKRHFADEESARAEAVLYGIGLTAPLYR